MQDYADQVTSGALTKKGKWEGDFEFQQLHPSHPLTSENRGKRMKAADVIRDLTMDWQISLPAEILDRIHVVARP